MILGVDRIIEDGESVQAAFSAYTEIRLGRRVIGVTDRRFLLVKSSYWAVNARRLLWADPIQRVALREKYPWHQVVSPMSKSGGNSYLEIRRATGETVTLNMRQFFVGRHSSGDETITALRSLVPRWTGRGT